MWPGIKDSSPQPPSTHRDTTHHRGIVSFQSYFQSYLLPLFFLPGGEVWRGWCGPWFLVPGDGGGHSLWVLY